MIRRLVVASAVVALGLVGVVPGFAADHPAAGDPPLPIVGAVAMTLANTVPAIVHAATNLGSVDPVRSLHVVLPLALPDPGALNRYVASQYQAGTRKFHRFLSPAQFGDRFGAAPAEVSVVTDALRHLGLQVGAAGPNRLYVTASGPAQLLEGVFGTVIDRFHVGTRSFFANTADIRLPAQLVGVVTGVIGLDDASRPQPQINPGQTSAQPTAASPTATPELLTIGQDGGATPCPAAVAGVGYTAPQLATAYNFDGLYAKGFLGQGMSAALVEFDDYHDSNVAAVKSCYHLDTPVTRRVVDGGTGGPPAGGEIEDMADITTMLEMLPKLAHLYVYVAPTTSLGEIDLYNQFVADDTAPVISSSWGSCEELASAADNRLYADITEEAAAQGQQIFDAAGDAGAVDCSSLFPSPTGDSVSVEQEAAVPWVTGVGGTDLGERTANGLPGPRDEATWNDDAAGGGGVSALWRMPEWQSEVKSARAAPGHSGAACGAPTGQLCREVPDISADADSDFGMQGGKLQLKGDVGSPGYSFYCATTNCSLLGNLVGLPIPLPPISGIGGWQPVGGTSLSTPLTAAAAVLWDQAAKAAHLDGLGLINPSLYRIAANPASYARDFHDITTDSNDAQYDHADCPDGCNKSQLYKAGKGYDMATGLGSYDATNLGDDLVKTAEQVTLLPDHVTVYGYHHGVATTAPVAVSDGFHDATYTAKSDASWLQVHPGRAPGSLHWSVTPAGLATGMHHGHITIDVDGHPATLTVAYSVTPPAKMQLSTTHLHFHEIALNSSGKPTIATCAGPLWDDELFDAVDGSSGHQAPASTKQTLRITNAGPAGSELHWQAFPASQIGEWLSVDLQPKHVRPAQRPGAALVPTDGTEGAAQQGRLRLVSTANINALGGYPAMQQGVYHATVKVYDLADPRIVRTVHASLVLGNGHGTPYIRSFTKSTVLHLSQRQTKTFTIQLSDGDGACGYAYSVGSNEDWARPAPSTYSGAVPPTGTRNVSVTVSAKHLGVGRHAFTITVQSQTAEPNPDVMHFTVAVRR
ncbi:MAG TPA: S53 family peptidase [Mycobacteriales bacterium]|jgi:kumamolisin|nr:S53 family peptidase [Mycobacteriales bacterium]